MTIEVVNLSQIGLLAQFNVGLLFMEVLLFCTSLFLMLLILVQRGKGGGLTGALGGMGGQSAFGSKAGDAFTKITIITAIIWITLCMITIAAFNPPPRSQTAEKAKVESTGSISGEAGSTDENEAATDGAAATDGTESAILPGDSDATEEPSSDESKAGDGEEFQLNLEAPATNTSEAGAEENKAADENTETDPGK